jgi:hypothetical protein
MLGIRNAYWHDFISTAIRGQLKHFGGAISHDGQSPWSYSKSYGQRRKECRTIFGSRWYYTEWPRNLLVLGSFLNCDVEPGGSSVRRLLEIRKERSKYHIEMSPEEMALIEDFLLHAWKISPKKRATANELLQHRWFESLDS